MPGSMENKTADTEMNEESGYGKETERGKSVLLTLGDFLSTFLTALILILAAVFVLLRVLGWNMLCIESSSMSPEYPVGTLVIVQPVEAQTLEAGDVVTYVANADGVLVTHRVIQIDASTQTVVTKGDANNVEDSPVYWGNIVGKVVLKIPAVGTVFSVITAEQNRKAVIGIITALFALTIIFDVTGRRKKKKSEEKQKGAKS